MTTEQPRHTGHHHQARGPCSHSHGRLLKDRAGDRRALGLSTAAPQAPAGHRAQPPSLSGTHSDALGCGTALQTKPYGHHWGQGRKVTGNEEGPEATGWWAWTKLPREPPSCPGAHSLSSPEGVTVPSGPHATHQGSSPAPSSLSLLSQCSLISPFTAPGKKKSGWAFCQDGRHPLPHTCPRGRPPLTLTCSKGTGTHLSC